MVFVLLFDSTLRVPLSYHWGQDMYELCPGCVRAHERRTCDGHTDVTFEFCEKHTKGAAKDKYLDHTMLNDIRRLIHPLHSAVATYPVTAAGITVTSTDDLRKKVKVIFGPEGRFGQRVFFAPSATLHPSNHGPKTGNVMNANLSNATNATRTGTGVSASHDASLNAAPMQHLGQARPQRFRAIPFVVDVPNIKTSYAHAKGCAHSDDPDVVFKSREAVEAMDQFARERLANINALLEAGVDYELSPGPDTDSVMGGQDHGERGFTSDVRRAEDSTSSSSSTASTQSTQGATPDADLSAEAAARLILLNSESEARALLRAEKTRVEECLATSGLAKGIYFKRCNGQWISALGDVLPYGNRREAATKVKTEIVREEVRRRVGHKAARMGFQTQMWMEDGEEKVLIDQARAFKSQQGTLLRQPPSELKRAVAVNLEDETSIRSMIDSVPRKPWTWIGSSIGGSNTTVNTGTESTISTSTTSASTSLAALQEKTVQNICAFTKLLPVSSPPSAITSVVILEKALRISPPATAKSISTILPVDDSTMAHGYALIRPDDEPVCRLLLPRVSLSRSCNNEKVPSEYCAACQMGTPCQYYHSFRYFTASLMAREEMVRSGQCSQEDLIVTSWGYNRLVTKQIMKRMEDGG